MSIAPSISDYRTALRLPEKFVRIPALKGAEYTKARDGGPLTHSGSFACVFRARLISGKEVALRLPTRSLSEFGLHTHELAKHLQARHVSCIQPPEVHRQAVVAKGTLVPAEVMPWVTGKNLLKTLKTEPTGSLSALRDAWLKTVMELESQSIGHGDFQPANILLRKSGSSFKIGLIDFDSIVVPALVGKPEHVHGVPAFQHRNRSQVDRKDLRVDRFSALLIYAAITAFEQSPSLHESFKKRKDENLLIDDSDLAHPAQSATLGRLATASGEAGRLYTHLRTFAINNDPLACPALASLVSSEVVTITDTSSNTGTQARQRPASPPSNTPPSPRPAGNPKGTRKPAWLQTPTTRAMPAVGSSSQGQSRQTGPTPQTHQSTRTGGGRTSNAPKPKAPTWDATGKFVAASRSTPSAHTGSASSAPGANVPPGAVTSNALDGLLATGPQQTVPSFHEATNLMSSGPVSTSPSLGSALVRSCQISGELRFANGTAYPQGNHSLVLDRQIGRLEVMGQLMYQWPPGDESGWVVLHEEPNVAFNMVVWFGILAIPTAIFAFSTVAFILLAVVCLIVASVSAAFSRPRVAMRDKHGNTILRVLTNDVAIVEQRLRGLLH